MRLRLTALSGVLGAALLVAQVALAPLPNIELVSLLVMLFTLALGRYVAYSLAVFVLLEGLIYGFGLWWFSYLYIWAILAVATYLFRRMESRLGWALLCGFYGDGRRVHHQRHPVRPAARGREFPACAASAADAAPPAGPPHEGAPPQQAAGMRPRRTY